MWWWAEEELNAEAQNAQRVGSWCHRVVNGLIGCLGPSVPVQHAGRKKRAPWPAHRTAVRKKQPATRVGMTESEKRDPRGARFIVPLRVFGLKSAEA